MAHGLTNKWRDSPIAAPLEMYVPRPLLRACGQRQAAHCSSFFFCMQTTLRVCFRHGHGRNFTRSGWDGGAAALREL